MPFNLTSLHQLLPSPEADRLEERLVAAFGYGSRVPVLKLREHADGGLRELGRFVYDTLFVNYTRKQWGLDPSELDPTVTGRVPVMISHDDRYFTDAHQGIPRDGYHALVQRMLAHPSITVLTGCDHRDLGSATTWDRMLYTGPIDEFFGHRFGALPYRSLVFEHETVEADRVQPVAVVNRPGPEPFTRTLEHVHFSGQHLGRSTITTEYPAAYTPGENEPFYPVPQPANRARHERYEELARELDGRVWFAGRLGQYRYLDMDQAVSHALVLSRRLVTPDDPAPLTPGVATPIR